MRAPLSLHTGVCLEEKFSGSAVGAHMQGKPACAARRLFTPPLPRHPPVSSISGGGTVVSCHWVTATDGRLARAPDGRETLKPYTKHAASQVGAAHGAGHR